jgi:hypothetical protein
MSPVTETAAHITVYLHKRETDQRRQTGLDRVSAMAVLREPLKGLRSLGYE